MVVEFLVPGSHRVNRDGWRTFVDMSVYELVGVVTLLSLRLHRRFL